MSTPRLQLSAKVDIILHQEGNDLARKRFQKTGHIYKDGRWWRVRWREDAIDETGALVRSRPSAVLGIAIGPGALTKKQAERLAWDTVLSKVDAYTRCPKSLMTMMQFVVQKFEPEHIWTLKKAGKEHYKYCLSKILPALGDMKLLDIRTEHVQALCRSLVANGKSIQTAKHIKTATHTIFEHAKATGHYAGDNPAGMVRLPEGLPNRVNSLSFDQAAAAMDLMPSPIREMVFVSSTTSANVAELCGLRWGRVNLTAEFATFKGDSIPPLSMAICENWYRNTPGTVKSGARNRIVPLTAAAVEMLLSLRSSKDLEPSPHEYCFAGRTGNPIDAHNTNSRLFKKIGKVLKFKFSWHMFRHSCATFAEQVGMARSDRIAMMGHAAGKMTDHYTHSDIERRRVGVEKIAAELAAARERLKISNSGQSLASMESKTQCLQ